MKTTLPTDCGNAPRISIVGDFVTSWARGDSAALEEWLTDDVDWAVFAGAPKLGEHLVTSLEVTSIITHGRLASCDGFVDTDHGRVAFSHVFRFASTSKTAKIREARTYLVERPA